MNKLEITDLLKNWRDIEWQKWSPDQMEQFNTIARTCANISSEIAAYRMRNPRIIDKYVKMTFEERQRASLRGEWSMYDTLPVEIGKCSTCGCKPGTRGYGSSCQAAPTSCPTRGDYYTGYKGLS